jgi:hypothetical protein
MVTAGKEGAVTGGEGFMAVSSSSSSLRQPATACDSSALLVQAKMWRLPRQCRCFVRGNDASCGVVWQVVILQPEQLLLIATISCKGSKLISGLLIAAGAMVSTNSLGMVDAAA